MSYFSEFLFQKVNKANSLAFKKATKLRWWLPGGIIPGIRIQVHAMFAPFWTSCLAPIAMSRAHMENPMAIKLCMMYLVPPLNPMRRNAIPMQFRMIHTMSIFALRLDAATTRKMAHKSLRPKMTIKMMATVPQNPQTARSVKIRLIAFRVVVSPGF